jgi:hypothetical protein
MIRIVSLVPGDDGAGAEPLQVPSVTVVSAPSNGAATFNPVDGSIQYMRKRDSDSSTYQMCDSSSPTTLCDTASVIIVMQPLAGVGFQYRLVTIDYDIWKGNCGDGSDGSRRQPRWPTCSWTWPT